MFILGLGISLISVLSVVFVVHYKFARLKLANLDLIVNDLIEQRYIVCYDETNPLKGYFLIPSQEMNGSLSCIYHIDFVKNKVFKIPRFDRELFYIGKTPFIDRERLKPYVLCQLEAKFQENKRNEIVVSIGEFLIKEELDSSDFSDIDEGYFFNSKLQITKGN